MTKTAPREAFVTTLNTDDYLPGVLALDKTLRDTCYHSLIVLTSGDLSLSTYEALERREIQFIITDDVPVDPAVFNNLQPIYRHWSKTLFKLRIFELIQFVKIVFVDCDIMVLDSLDDLFAYPDMSAVIAGKSYPGNDSWSNLNSGLLVIEPREGLVEKIMGVIHSVAAEKQNFGDQDLLGAFFHDWVNDENLHLPETYNVFFDHYRFYSKNQSVKALHFIGKDKPWMMTRRRLFKKLIGCLFKGNASGVRMLLRYRRCLREVNAIG